MSTLVMKIRGKVVYFRVKEINRVYVLPDFEQSLFTIKDYAPGSWLALKICLGKILPLVTSKVGITLNEYRTEARI